LRSPGFETYQRRDQEIGFFDQEENAAGSLTAGVASQASHVSAAIGLVWQQLITSGGK
jgi:hypothetical protein